MAFFKFRKRGDEPSAVPVQPENVDAIRRRAKHRLIGAAVLVLVGVIGFPMLFDKQPRPIAVDTPIEIPDKNKVKPLNIPASAAIESLKAEVAAPVASEPVAVEAPKAAVIPAPPPVEKQIESAAVKPDDGAKAKALLEGHEPEKNMDAGEGRFVVQVGAFSDAVRAREVRLKVERGGLKTYTQVAETKDGRRIRVRVGPFGTRLDADKAAEKIRKLDLPAAILTL